MDSVRSHLETLTEDSQGEVNYISWRFKLNLTLKSKSLYEIATGITVKPEGPVTKDNVKQWMKDDIEAQTLIGLNVSSNIAKKIANCESSSQMLSKLEVLYGKRSEFSIEGLQRKFFTYKYDVSKSATENCMQINQLAEDLKTEGEEIKESWIITRILSTLPQKLHHFRVAWDSTANTDKNLSKLLERLQLEEDRLKEMSCDSENQSAFIAKNYKKGQSTNNNKSSNTSIECFKCGQKGHLKKNCRNKPCSKYLEYCKSKYSCNICKEKGHFAKDCSKNNSQECSSVNNNEKKRRACVTVALTVSDIKKMKLQNNDNYLWHQDCAATQHMTSHKDLFINYKKLEEPIFVIIGDATEMESIGVGDINMEAYNGEEWTKIVLKDVLHVPSMPFNLFSVISLLDKGYVQVADSSKSTFYDKENETAVMASREGDLFRMLFRQEKSVSYANIRNHHKSEKSVSQINESSQEKSENCMVATSLKVWHKRLAHQNARQVKETLERNNIKFVDDWNDHVCIGCTYGKQHRVSHPANLKVAEKPLDVIHVDLGEMDIRSLGGAKYFLLFKDDYTHFKTVYFLKSKDEAYQKLQLLMNLLENQFGRKVKKLMSDNGREIQNTNSNKLLEELGVFHAKTCTYTPQQNGRIEREMRTVVEAARSVIHGMNLNQNLWAEAINYAVFTLNQTGTSSVKGKSPAELWFGRKIDVKKLRIFGSECYVYIEKHKRGKMDKKSQKGIFVGYDLDSPSYRIYIEDKDDVISSENVIFNEMSETNEGSMDVTLNNSQSSENEDETSNDETASNENEDFQSVNSESESISSSEEIPQTIRKLRNRQNLKRPVKYSDYDVNFAMISETNDILISDALKDPNWKKAIFDEYDSLVKMKTWKLIESPDHVKPLTCRWVLRKKENGKFKARLVVRGFEQVQGVNYYETFSPVARYPSIRLIFSIAASRNLKLMTFDVKTAFLHSKLNEEIYMQQPEGFDDKSGRVCKLQKSLYGLKQAPKEWYEKISKFLKKLGFSDTDDDPCIYYNKDVSIIIALFVDDGLVAGENEKEMIEILKKLSQKFEINYDTATEGKLDYLGMEIECNSEEIFIHQSKYTERIINNFNFNELNTVFTPIERGMTTDEENFVNDKPLDNTKPYREAIGSLLYLAGISRPDISFAVNYLSRYCNKPMIRHWKMIKRIFQYLKGSTKFGIKFNGSSKLIAYSDADYGGDPITRHSTTGVLIERGGPIVWYSQKQRLVATSTAEAEYRAAVSSIDDISWIRRISKELNIESGEPTTLYVDNQSAIHILASMSEGKVTKGKKHIEIPRKFIQEHLGKTIKLEHVSSANQTADILTKALDRNNFTRLRSKIIKEEYWD